MNDVHGSKAFYGLDPVVAAMELIFNTEAYHDLPVLYIKDKGILRDLTKYPIEVTEEQRRRIFKSRSVSYRFLTSPAVRDRLAELSGQMLKNRAMGRVSKARYFYENMAGLLTIVPHPQGDVETPWLSVLHLLDDAMRTEAGVSQEQADAVIAAFRGLQQAWVDRDVDGINKGITALTTVLPTLAPAGVYPSLDKRKAEVTYRRLNLIKYSWACYIFAFFVSIFAVSTRYRWTRRLGLLFLVAAAGLHGYDLWLRWGVIGRVPVANMYEAVVSSTWVGVMFALLLELFTKKRVYLLSASLLGFFALALPELMPDQINNKLVTMMPILDDIMLRIHTVLIISSYAVITLAWGVANCYLFVSAKRERSALAQGTIGAQVGTFGCLFMAYFGLFEMPWGGTAWLARKMGTYSESALIVSQFFITMLVSIASCAWIGIEVFRLFGRGKHAGASGLVASDFPVERGGGILEEFDRSHQVLIYTASVALFVGIVLGAMWADYSWGRPWGWDPKEVFALNTWLVYAILIHARFVTKRRALWTSVLSVFGFAAMQFNWWVVNFYIVGLHSYA